MKINVSVELDWVGEDESIDEAIERRVIDAVVSKVVSGVSNERVELIRGIVEDKIDSGVNELMSEFLSKDFIETDYFGQKKGEPITIKQMLENKLQSMLTESVNTDGKPTNYNGKPRYQHLLDSSAKKLIEEFHKNVSKTVVDGIKSDINNEAVQRVTKAILADYSLKDLIK